MAAAAHVVSPSDTDTPVFLEISDSLLVNLHPLLGVHEVYLDLLKCCRATFNSDIFQQAGHSQ